MRVNVPPAQFLSTPSARRATASLGQSGKNYDISIHALREEGDVPRVGRLILFNVFLSTPSARRATAAQNMDNLTAQYISIHALREEGDDAATLTLRAQIEFLSTPSARRATSRELQHLSGINHFYPRPPRGGRPYTLDDVF